jgi:hypothetical protein
MPDGFVLFGGTLAYASTAREATGDARSVVIREA